MHSQSIDNFDDIDDYIANTPLEARFDPSTIELIVTEAFPKHDAYGMLFADYHAKRSCMQGYDESDKKRLSFRFPAYFAHVAADIALLQKVSLHRSIVLLVELGLIHFQVDYHDSYADIRTWRTDSYKNLKTEESLRKYRRMERHGVVIGSAVTGRASPQFVPSVPEWLYNAVMDIKSYLNMSGSDFVFFCWCYGCINCMTDDQIPEIIREDIKKSCNEFDYEIREYQRQITLLK